RPRLVDRLALEAPEAPALVVGDGAAAFAGFDGVEADSGPALPDARHVARAALRELGDGPLPTDFPAPPYLRGPDARRPEETAPVLLRRAGPEAAEPLSALHARCFAEGWGAGFIGRLLDRPDGMAIMAREREG